MHKIKLKEIFCRDGEQKFLFYMRDFSSDLTGSIIATGNRQKYLFGAI